MTDQAAEAREASFDTTYWRNRAKTAKRIAAELGDDEPSPVEGMLAACDTVDALSARLAQAEQERDEAQKFWEDLKDTESDRLRTAEARLREYEEAIEIEYKCAHGHRWWMTTEPKHCPGCNTSSFSLVDAEPTDSASGGRKQAWLSEPCPDCGFTGQYDGHVCEDYFKARLRVTDALLREYEEALTDLHAEVEMAESVGICLPDRVPSLRAGDLLAAKAASGGREA